jgi:hypothetical protein
MLDKDSLRATQPFDITSIKEHLYPVRKDMSDKKNILLQVSSKPLMYQIVGSTETRQLLLVKGHIISLQVISPPSSA